MNDIILVPYQPGWPKAYEEWRQKIIHSIGMAEDNGAIFKIAHCGSTSVPELIAKPIIDILIDINPFYPTAKLVNQLTALGFSYKGEYGIHGREYFSRDDCHVHAIHTDKNKDFIGDHLIFRDYLRHHPEARLQYQKGKERSLMDSKGSRPLYQELKGPTIDKIMEKARDWYFNQKKFSTLLEALAPLKSAPFFWALASGQALAWNLGRPYRYSSDIDLIIWKDEGSKVLAWLHQQGYRVDIVEARGRYRRWNPSDPIPDDCMQAAARITYKEGELILLDLLFTERKEGRWFYKRDSKIHYPIDQALPIVNGIRSLRSDLVLLFKGRPLEQGKVFTPPARAKDAFDIEFFARHL